MSPSQKTLRRPRPTQDVFFYSLLAHTPKKNSEINCGNKGNTLNELLTCNLLDIVIGKINKKLLNSMKTSCRTGNLF